MRALIPGFELDEERSRILFTDRMEFLSTLGEASPEGLGGISLGEPSEGMLSVPAFGKKGSLGVSVLEAGEWTRVAAVASSDMSAGISRAGEFPDLQGGGTTVVLMIDARLPRFSAARAMVTVTEAITAVIRELGLGCRGRASATGSETQNIVVVTRKDSDLVLSGAGKHTKLGELIGRTSKEAVRSSSEANGAASCLSCTADRLGLDAQSLTKEDRRLEPVLLALLQIRDGISWGFLPRESGMEAARSMASAVYGCDYSGCDSVEDIAKTIVSHYAGQE